MASTAPRVIGFMLALIEHDLPLMLGNDGRHKHTSDLLYLPYRTVCSAKVGRVSAHHFDEKDHIIALHQRFKLSKLSNRQSVI